VKISPPTRTTAPTCKLRLKHFGRSPYCCSLLNQHLLEDHQNESKEFTNDAHEAIRTAQGIINDRVSDQLKSVKLEIVTPAVRSAIDDMGAVVDMLLKAANIKVETLAKLFK
jgi:hypothetical protein